MRGNRPTSNVRSPSARASAGCVTLRPGVAIGLARAGEHRPVALRRHPAQPVGEERVALRPALGESPGAREDEEPGPRVRQLPQGPGDAIDALARQQRLLEQPAILEIALAV